MLELIKEGSSKPS